MRQFIDEHFNVLILVLLFIGAGSVLLHVVHHAQDQTVVNWLEHVSDQILAALLGMMTGYRLGQNSAPTSLKIDQVPSDKKGG